ncbi:hypothetical protein GCM10012275_09030 [Longimycelium tulufanense]|uniref:Transglutaminase-like domain-containing protein n=1 Tax=Longimycelium tulufanense TaxID=907463 RepID=A0A8J3CB36_9PSEU|nr:transglutaminase domain-containing protein [Longimycelium tulufanense]GGM40238.1 hypothetical protein GCM10012275_09030 [Longimycelium tulufanense]
MTRDRGSRVLALIEVTLCGVATTASGLVYGRFFATGEYLVPVSAAALGSVVAAAVVGLRGWRSVRTLVVAVAGFCVLVTYFVFGDTLVQGIPTRQTGVELGQGVLGGWARMLTVALPADVRGSLVITPVLITWVTGFATTLLALRTRSVFAPVAPALLAFVVALLFVGKQPGIQVSATAVFLGAALSLALLRANWIATANPPGHPATPVPDTAGRRGRGTAGRIALGLPVIMTATVVGIAGGHVVPLASGAPRFDPRVLRPPPLRVAESLSPLVELKAQLREEPPRQLFTVRIHGGSKPIDRIRTAALDEFDGVLWTSSDRFLVAGQHLATDPAVINSGSVAANIELNDLSGPFLPVLGWPSRLDVVTGDISQIGFSDTSGILVTAQQDLRGIEYDLVATVSDRDDDLTQAAPSNTTEYARYTTLRDLPSQLRGVAQQLVASEPTPYGKLVAIERHLRGLPYQLDAQPGHSYAALTRLLVTASPDEAKGYAEQHASAFAVLARAAGFPARVAVGYRLRDSSAGTYTVTTRDAHAWAEVHFTGYGWVAFEPTDLGRTTASSRSDPEDSVLGRSQPNPPLVAPPRPELQPDTTGSSETGWARMQLGPLLVAILVLSVAVLTAAMVVAEKARRRWRRRHARDNAARALGAWHEAIERLVERGITIPVTMTAREIAERATSVLGSEADAVVAMAPLATAAEFAADAPDEHDVQRAWQLENQLRRQMSARRSWLSWLRAQLNPRPLFTDWQQDRQRRKSLQRLGVR